MSPSAHERVHSRSTREGAIFCTLVKEGMRGKSIGYNPLSDPIPLRTGGYRYELWEVVEYSCVGIPCNGGIS
jgi:hypothetical protein